jgi:hypothetical protein
MILEVSRSNPNSIQKLQNVLKSNKSVYVKIYKDSCGACQNVAIGWSSLNEFDHPKNVYIASVEADCCSDIKHRAFNNIQYVPTFRHIQNNIFDDFSLPSSDVTSSVFMKWIQDEESKHKKSSKRKTKKTKKTKKAKKGKKAKKTRKR